MRLSNTTLSSANSPNSSNASKISNSTNSSNYIQAKQVEDLSGSVERITYHNTDNGFCVLRVACKGHKDLVTVIGNVPVISAGEYVKCVGMWNNDTNHGLQFKASIINALKPNSLEGMEKYLGSGLIKGIGPHFAKKLVKKFGVDVFDVIETYPERLLTVEKIGKIRAASICANWKGQKIVREIMVFLQSHGISTARATRIYKTYGDKAIEIVSNNPYKLAHDIRGIGFISADTIAGNLGIAKDSLIRARAGVHHVLFEATSEGHCGLPQDLLVERSSKLLEINDSLICEGIIQETEIGALIQDTLESGIGGTKVGKSKVGAIFLASYYVYEKNSSQMLTNLLKGKTPWESIDIAPATSWVEKKLNITLADAQKLALSKALQTKIMVITGGPGTGKTTLINSILTILQAKKLRIKLCAPTGRAARRLNESTNLEATTIHRLLEIDPINGGFKRNKNNKFECDYLVIDEASMVDSQLFHSILQAMPQNIALLLVGDVDQLPSVGAGQVLKDIIDSEQVATIKLREIFRQAATSNIITAAHLVNHGKLPKLDYKISHSSNTNINPNPHHNSDLHATPHTNYNYNDNNTSNAYSNSKPHSNISNEVFSDFYFVPAEPGENLIHKLIEIVIKRIPSRFGFHAIKDIQVLAPMQRGGSGARSLNIELQKALNPNHASGVLKFGEYFAKYDKVMQTENNYDKEVYNGDIGEIKSINEVEQEVTITFYSRDVVYDYTDLDQITLAYATTIHKSQGSEYPVVIIPLTMQSFRMLKRNLIYTAITRGKKLVIIIGEKKAFAIAVKNSKNIERYTKLKFWLQNPEF